MSHGASDETIEPNLVPLLDLVLQLLMFFLIQVNFVQGVTNTGESLPYSETAGSLDAEATDPIILSVKPFRINMDGTPNKRDDFRYYSPAERDKLRHKFPEDGQMCIVIPTEDLTAAEKDQGTGRDVLVRDLFNASERLKRLAQDERDLAEREKKNNRGKALKVRVDDAGNVTVPIHIRADADVKTGDIYQLMDACKEAGFVTIKARALLGSGEGKSR